LARTLKNVDLEWIKLISEAQKMGISAQDIREFLLQSQCSRDQQKMIYVELKQRTNLD
jgi:DNA-binding transcriptional MerR regulator